MLYVCVLHYRGARVLAGWRRVAAFVQRRVVQRPVAPTVSHRGLGGRGGRGGRGGQGDRALPTHGPVTSPLTRPPHPLSNVYTPCCSQSDSIKRHRDSGTAFDCKL